MQPDGERHAARRATILAAVSAGLVLSLGWIPLLQSVADAGWHYGYDGGAPGANVGGWAPWIAGGTWCAAMIVAAWLLGGLWYARPHCATTLLVMVSIVLGGTGWWIGRYVSLRMGSASEMLGPRFWLPALPYALPAVASAVFGGATWWTTRRALVLRAMERVADAQDA